MKPKKWAAPRPAVRWGLYDATGALVLVERHRGNDPSWNFVKVRVVPMSARYLRAWRRAR